MVGSVACTARCLASSALRRQSSALRRQVSLSDDIRGSSSRRARYAVGGGGGGPVAFGGGGLGGLGGKMATRKVKRVLVLLMSAFSTPHRLEEKPRLPKWTGLELDRVRPLKSSVSPSAPTRNVAFGSAPCLTGICSP